MIKMGAAQRSVFFSCAYVYMICAVTHVLLIDGAGSGNLPPSFSDSTEAQNTSRSSEVRRMSTGLQTSPSNKIPPGTDKNGEQDVPQRSSRPAPPKPLLDVYGDTRTGDARNQLPSLRTSGVFTGTGCGSSVETEHAVENLSSREEGAESDAQQPSLEAERGNAESPDSFTWWMASSVWLDLQPYHNVISDITRLFISRGFMVEDKEGSKVFISSLLPSLEVGSDYVKFDFANRPAAYATFHEILAYMFENGFVDKGGEAASFSPTSTGTPVSAAQFWRLMRLWGDTLQICDTMETDVLQHVTDWIVTPGHPKAIFLPVRVIVITWNDSYGATQTTGEGQAAEHDSKNKGGASLSQPAKPVPDIDVAGHISGEEVVSHTKGLLQHTEDDWALEDSIYNLPQSAEGPEKASPEHSLDKWAFLREYDSEHSKPKMTTGQAYTPDQWAFMEEPIGIFSSQKNSPSDASGPPSTFHRPARDAYDDYTFLKHGSTRRRYDSARDLTELSKSQSPGLPKPSPRKRPRPLRPKRSSASARRFGTRVIAIGSIIAVGCSML